MPEKLTFLQYYWGTVSQPGTTFRAIAGDEHRLRPAFRAVAIAAVLYTLVYVFLIMGDGRPYKPWLDIPPEEYYHWNVFFCAPSMFLGWVLAAGVVHAISRMGTPAGTFDQILGVFGFGLSVSSWTTGIHDLVTSCLGAVGVINQQGYEVMLNSPTIWRALLWIQMAAYLLCFSFFFSKGVRAVYGFSFAKSTALGFAGFVIYQLFFLIFNR